MPKITSYTLFSAVILGVAVHVKGESSPRSQCGGVNWTGSNTCVSGSVCSKINDYYSQCIPNSNTTASTSPTALPNLPTTSSSSSPPSGSSTPGLHKIALTSSRYFGCATDNGELKDSSYVQILQNSNEFGVITPGNSMKWDATEKSRGVFDFSGGDAVVKFAEGNGQKVRGHCLVWHSQLPNWVSNGGFDKATLTSIIQNHVTQLVTKWKGRIFHWDVVNEPFNEDGTFRTSVFYKTLGEEFISIALRAARAADPSAKLFINDYNIDGTSSKSTAMYNLISRLKAAKVPLDGVGVQAHLIAGSVPSTFKSNLERFAELGVEVAVTELDIRMKLPATSELLVQQAKDYKMVAESCKAVDKCVGITIWDYTDKYSWIPSVFPGQGAALPWDENLAKKPAYAAIATGLA